MAAAWLNYYTTWSCALMAVAVVLIMVVWARPTLFAGRDERRLVYLVVESAVVNMLTVQSLGPMIMYMGDLPISDRKKLRYNALLHALPAVVALAYAMNYRMRSRAEDVIGLVAAFALTYLAFPSQSGFAMGKLQRCYGVQWPTAWSVATIGFAATAAASWKSKKQK